MEWVKEGCGFESKSPPCVLGSMNRATLLGVGLLSLGTLAGCGYYPGYDDGYYDGYSDGAGTYYPTTPGDVSLNWSFDGMSCAQVPEVQSVWVSIPGERLQNDGIYPCQFQGVPGVVLHDFAPGDYSFSLEGVGYRGERFFVGSGVFTVDGSVHLSVDLVPYGGPGGYAYLQWKLPATAGSDGSQLATSCREAGVEQVAVRIDGGETQTYSCLEGTLGQGARSARVAAGTHRIDLTALGKDGAKRYVYSGELKVDPKEAVSATFGLK